jgi:hypothetical protein
MHKLTNHIIILLLLTSSLLAGDFRDAKWGTSMEQVMTLEKLPLEEIDIITLIPEVARKGYQNKNNETVLKGNDTIYNGKECIIHYIFENDSLVIGQYVMNHENIDPAFDYYKILNKKYGPKPKYDDLLDVPRETLDRSISLSKSVWMKTRWETDSSYIDLITRGPIGNFYYRIEYGSLLWERNKEKQRWLEIEKEEKEYLEKQLKD